MSPFELTVIWVVIGYFSGSVPFGLILTQLFVKKDVRAEGSGNIGATNVARVAGKKLGAVVLVLDAAKAAIPVVLAMQFLPDLPATHAAVGLAAFLGHVFPPWLKFKGGKGVATALGSLIVLLPWAALAGFAVWVAVILTMRVSSVGSLLGGLVAIIGGFVMNRPVEYPLLAVLLLVLMIFTHRSNLERLFKRQEHRV